jgi:hypothetical protein
MIDYELIESAQNKLWRVSTKNIKNGDLFWLLSSSGYEPEMYITDNMPLIAEKVSDFRIYFKIDNMFDSIEISDRAFVYKAPPDFNQNKELYQSPEYWIDKAKELNLE